MSNLTLKIIQVICGLLIVIPLVALLIDRYTFSFTFDQDGDLYFVAFQEEWQVFTLGRLPFIAILFYAWLGAICMAIGASIWLFIRKRKITSCSP